MRSKLCVVKNQNDPTVLNHSDLTNHTLSSDPMNGENIREYMGHLCRSRVVDAQSYDCKDRRAGKGKS